MPISEKFLEAVMSREPVAGFTHDFYRYPARFSPLFAREAIEAFTSPGDTVFDPFMGGGTTLVEAQLLGRNGVGTDVSSLAVFVAQAKTMCLTDKDFAEIYAWAKRATMLLNLRNRAIRATDWQDYQRNINTRQAWPVRKLLELALASLDNMGARSQMFVRCVLLRTAQWAVDCRSEIPAAAEIRRQLAVFLDAMLTGAKEYRKAATMRGRPPSAFCLHRSALGIDSDPLWGRVGKPALILTSPPYPGVHVLYHRWQINGRRETPAPFWIAGSLDGCGSAFYTFGDRKQQNLRGYYEQAAAAFKSLANIAEERTTIVQLVAFADPSWQLAKYLDVLNAAGFQEVRFPDVAKSTDGRIWRSVPNRKWYATQQGDIGASKEVVLFHKLNTA